MPFQPINFAGIEPQGNEFMRNLAQNLTNAYKSGFEMKEMPGQVKRKREEDEFKNAMDKIKLEQAQNPVASIDDILKRKKLEAETSKLNAETNNLTNPKVDPLAEFKSQLLQLQVQKAQKDLDAAQTPEEQEAAKLRLYEAQKKIDAQYAKPKDELSSGTRTQIEKEIEAIDRLDPLLEELENYQNPSNSYIFDDPNQKAYSTLVTSTLEPLMSGGGWLGIKENVKKAEDMVRIGASENLKEYRARIKSIRERGKKEREKNLLKLGRGTQNSSKRIIKVEGAPKGFQNFTIDGVPYDSIPDAEVPTFLELMEKR